jgi:PAS domain S-box-containing protein
LSQYINLQKFVITSALTLLELQSAIIRDPLVLSADATVMDAIALMSSGRSQCDAENHSDNHQQQFQQDARSSCVLVLEDEKLIGVITERDVVRLSAQQQNLNRLLVHEVMAHPVVTMRESDLTDLFLAVNLLQQYRIRHLPLLDDRDLLVGMVTHESLRQISRPIDLMRLRLVSEVMTPDVVCAASDRSMLAIAQMMAEQKISSVMIVETCITDTSLQIPVGIVTERDVVQFQALGLNLETCMAHTVMSTPIFAVKPEDNLLTVQQIMEQRLIRRLAVTGEFGELLGIVTQTSLLQALNPTEIYNLAKVLEAKVEQLESEKATLLKHRNIELERQVHERTTFLLEAEKALQKINQSLELTVQERTQELWQVNKLQRAILDGTDYAIISTDLNGIIQTFNAGAEKMLGYSTEEVIGKITPEIFFDHQELIDRTSSISGAVEQNNWRLGTLMSLANQGILNLSQEWTNIRKDGSRFPAEISVTVLTDDDGKTIGFLSVRKDITAH